MEKIIQPRVLKGFRDSLPESEILRNNLIESLVQIFHEMAYVPIDTPVLEYAEILLGKSGGETEKQIYRFKDHGNRDVALRFDLTVPFARFMAEHLEQLYLPFRRYHIAKVWRGENTQKGRYREFMQCDFDIVGVDSVSADFDIIQTIYFSLKKLKLNDFKIRLNHRGIFNDFLKTMVNSENISAEIMRTIDKIGKLGIQKSREFLSGIVNDSIVDKIIEFVQPETDNNKTLEKMISLADGPSEYTRRISDILNLATAVNIMDYLILDPSITRGLDYYTGVVFETILDKNPDIGSICSGGRYDNLASLYTKQSIPGVGAAIGLDRLMAALEEDESGKTVSSFTKALILNLDNNLLAQYHILANDLRNRGVVSEVYPQVRKLINQFSYAEKKGIPYGIFFKTTETANILVKDLKTRIDTSFDDAKGVAKFILSLK